MKNFLSFGRSTFVGKEADEKRGFLYVKKPISSACVDDWEGMEKIYDHIFSNELRLLGEEMTVMLTENSPSFSERSQKAKQKMAELMFEKHKAKGIYIANSTQFVLYSSGKTDGLVAEMGEDCTQVVSFPQGIPCKESVRRIEFNPTNILCHLLHKKEIHPAESCLTKMKELTYVAQDYAAEKMMDSSLIEKSFDLPDGKIVTLSRERFECAEGLFSPELFEIKCQSIQSAIFDSVMSCDERARKHLFNTLLFSGGNSLLEGIDTRTKKELEKLVDKSTQVKVFAKKDRKYSAWQGASILGSLNSLSNSFLTNTQYEELGSDCVPRHFSF